MKNINADIRIKSVLKSSGQTDRSDIRLRGRYILRGDRGAIFYDEPQESMEDSSVMITAAGGSVSVKRSGSYESYMLYEGGRSHSASYKTPYGEVMMEFHTKSVRTRLSPSNAYIKLCYTIGTEGDATEAELEITAEIV